MSLSTTIEQLKKTLHRSDRTYAEARARHPALALYASPSAVLAAVGKGSPLSLRERDVLLLAILDERRRAPHPLWRSLLVVAFAPMLVRFRKAVKTAAAEVVGIVEAAGGEELRDALIARHAGDRSLKACLSSSRPVSHRSNENPQRPMTTKKIVSHSHVTSASTTPAISPSLTPSSPTPVVQPGAPSPTGGVTGGTLALFLKPPPSTASIPAVPSNFVPQSGTNYRGTGPKKAELVALPLAVTDLRNFTNYMTVIGTTAPPYDDIVQMFFVTNEWSSMRTASSAWDAYCVDQEGICWRAMRAAMDRLKPAFDLAATGDPTLTSKFAGLATLLGVKKAIAKKAVSTKRANKKAVAEGKAPVHGQVGKKRQKAADKAIVLAAGSGGTEVTPAAPTTPSSPAPTAPAASPVMVAVGAPVVTTGSPAPAAPTTPTNGAPAAPVNGTSATPH